MQEEIVPAGSPEQRSSEEYAHGSIEGHVLNERFLVERDMTDRSLGGGLRTFLIKDLKDFCRLSILKITKAISDDSGSDGPSLKQVCDVFKGRPGPNTEEILETGTLLDGRRYAVAVFYPGETLDRKIAGGKRMELDEAAEIISQTAEALAAAHSKGILHCDLRPANILIPASGVFNEDLRVLNFGTAWPLDIRGESLADAEPGCESLMYAAPELLVKLGHRSAASDIYSLSVLAYRLITGNVPFTAADRVGLLELINAGQVEPANAERTDLSDRASELISSGLQFEPAWRPQNLEEFAVRLVRALRPPKGLAPEPDEPLIEAEEILRPIPADDPSPTVEVILADKVSLPGPPAASVVSRPPAAGALVSDRVISWALIILLMAAALSIPVAKTMLAENNDAAAVGTVVERPSVNTRRNQMRFWIEPQDRSLRPGSREPGMEGNLNITSAMPGYAYVYYEVTAEDGRPNFIAAPLSPDGGKVDVEADKPFAAAIRPEGQRLPKAVWIVWTAVRSKDLDALRDAANKAPLNDDDRRKLRHFLERNRDLHVTVSSDPVSGRSLLDGSDEKIVYKLVLDEGEVPPL